MSHPVSFDPPGPIVSFLQRTGLAPRQSHKLLTLWPLLSDDARPRSRRYRPLADAAADGDIEVTEVSGGHVPNVRVANRGRVAALVLFGEQIKGAMQNRTANATFLIGAGDEVVIDVSCVEAGRWESRRSSDTFRSEGEVLSSSLRREMASRVGASRAIGGRFDAGQAEVWASVSSRLSASRTPSPTSAYEDYRQARLSDVREAGAAFHTLPGQVGFVAMIGDEVVGLEAIGRPEVFQRCFHNLLHAYLIDATDAQALRPGREPEPRFDDPGGFVAAIGLAPAHTGPSLGLGQDVRFTGSVSGCALVERDVVHLTAFPGAAA